MLLIFGLIVSVPCVVLASNALSSLMSRFPIIAVAGAALLGKVAIEMMLGDPWVVRVFPVGHWQQFALEACGAAGVVVAGRVLVARARHAMATPARQADAVAAIAEHEATSEPL